MLRWFAPLVVGLTLVAAGCGGGSSSSDTTTTTTETVTESSTTDTTTTDTTTTESTTTEASGTTGGTGFKWTSKDCQNLATAYAGLSAAVGAASSGQDVSGDVTKFSHYADQVPAAIRGDVKTLAAAYGTFVKELAKLGYKQGQTPTAEQLQQLQKASEPLATSEVQAASTHLSTWVTKNCTT